MNSTIVPCHAMSAVMDDETGTTAERTCQSPRSESGVTTVLVMNVVEGSAEGTESCFSQLVSAKSADIQRIKFLNIYKLGGVMELIPDWRQACGLSSRCRWYMFLRHPSLLYRFNDRKSTNNF